MSEFSAFLKSRRMALNLGLRELCRLTEKPFVPEPVSPTYYSRLENDGGIGGYAKMANVSIDKLWAIGVGLHVSPLLLFSLSRGLAMREFSVVNSDPMEIGPFLRKRRHEMGLSIRESCSRAEKAGYPISMGFWSQFETNFRGQSSKISGDKLWSIGCALDVDPLLLYVLSRNIDPRFLNIGPRQRLFSSS